MATIGLDNLYYSKITEDTSGNETYATPVKLARAIEASLTVDSYDAKLYSDDTASVIINDFKEGSITLGIEELSSSVAVDLFGCKKDKNGILVSSDTDESSYVAIGFRSRKANGKYRYIWLYRVKFKNPGLSFKTKGDNIEFSTPSIEGTFTARNKLDASGIRPWKVCVDEDEDGVSSSTISSWFTAVPEPEYATTTTSSAADTGGSN